MVASSSKLAAGAGVEILKAGGNAIDAAVATGFALAVAYPEAGNIGGGGYMVIRLADGTTAALDYREMAPQSALAEMYVDSSGHLSTGGAQGRSASGVPGAVAGLTTALAKYGTMPLARVMAPAIRMATDGIIVDSALARSVAGKERVFKRYGVGAPFLVDGKPIAAGALLKQPELAQTLQLIAEKGSAGFYRGRTAELIGAEMKRGCADGIASRARATHNCGLITTADLAAYHPAWRTPIRTTFRGYTIIGMPPSSSGGTTLGETLNILDGFKTLPPFGSVHYIHLLASAFQRAFMDRNELLGDPDFVKNAAPELTSRAHAEKIRKTISISHATPTPSLGGATNEGTETTHYSVVDKFGNAVATTTTLNSLYGSGVVIAGAGFFMNNTMDDFTSQPGTPNQFGLVQGKANAIAPGKRALSAMTPTIVLDPSNRLFMVVGARGGPRIITSVAEIILDVIANRMTLAEAMNAPRIHHQALPDTLLYDAGRLDSSVVTELRSMGYALKSEPAVGGQLVAIRRVRGGWEGMDDPRAHGGGAVGY